MGSSKAERDTTAFQLSHTIPLADARPEKLEQAMQTLRVSDWLSNVRVEGRRLRAAYDASAVNFRDIERLLDTAGMQRPVSLWWRRQSAWYRFLDANARSNALPRDGACCSRPPSSWHGDNGPDSKP